MQFRTEYSDFSFVDGVLIHQKENKFAGDVNTAKLRLRHVEFDAEFNPYEFTPHEPEDFEPAEDGDSITAYRLNAIDF